VKARERFSEIAALADQDIDLAEAALVIAAEEYESLDIEYYLGRLDVLAADEALSRAPSSELEESVSRLNRYLFDRCGFSGNSDHYEDPRNSYLNEVLERRSGIPISLAIVYIEVGRRIGLPTAGIGFPGHFLVKVSGPQDIIVDAFHGRVLSMAECEGKLRAVTKSQVSLEPDFHLRAATTREILVRMLMNLKHIGLRGGEFERALGCSDRILLLLPDAPEELRDRGLLNEKLQYYRAALADFKQLAEVAPQARTGGGLEQKIAELEGLVRRHYH